MTRGQGNGARIVKAEVRRQALAAWWRRGPWPCVILAVDPGKVSGASILVSRPDHGLRLAVSTRVDIFTRDLEAVVTKALLVADEEDLPLAAPLENWGRGGPRGLDQWIGLGEARGPWRRELIFASTLSERLTLSRIFLVAQNRWRSRVVSETGYKSGGEWAAFDAAGWKGAAKRSAESYFPESFVPPDDAAESACLGVYTARSDELLKRLPSRVLDRHGVPREDRHLLEVAIKRGVPEYPAPR